MKVLLNLGLIAFLAIAPAPLLAQEKQCHKVGELADTVSNIHQLIRTLPDKAPDETAAEIKGLESNIASLATVLYGCNEYSDEMLIQAASALDTVDCRLKTNA